MNLSLENLVSSSALQGIIVGNNVEEDDMLRWFSQEISFSKLNIGLRQGHGGPCGVLAVLQAELIKNLFFIDSISRVGEEITSIPALQRDLSFAKAIWNVLWRCRSNDFVYLVYSNESISNLHQCMSLPIAEYRNEEDFILSFTELFLSSYTQGSGCFLFLLSLIITRGVPLIKQEMDDPTASLIGQFGHCTQELINLLLLGEAVSNVFDGDVPIDPSSTDPNVMMLKGVHQRSEIGYLTQLEALRYCQVGSYLKIPIYPIWVIGSQSHFTIFFSLDREINNQSDEEKLFSRVQREFKALDTAECGFLQEDKLRILLSRLDVPFAHSQTDVQRFASFVQLDGGLILWSTFWENISKILTGTPLDTLLNSQQITRTANSTVSNTPLSQRPRSDSEIARELQANFDSNPFYDERSFTFSSNPPASTVQNRPRSDSEMARQMQEEWNQQGDAISTAPTASSGPSTAVLPPGGTKRHRSDSIATKDDENFVCYHYNGFDRVSTPSRNQPQNLTKLKLYRRSRDTSIGQSIGLTTAGAVFGDTTAENLLEEVLRTRWHGCRVDYLGNSPPVID